MNKSISEEVAAVLRASRIDTTSVTLCGDLDRSLYTKIDAVLKTAGGKWSRKDGHHVFSPAGIANLRTALETGTKVIDYKKAYQAFYTPPELADCVVAEARVSGASVLEPSAGRGALADAATAAGAESVTCVESDPDCVDVLISKDYRVLECDFLKLEPVVKYERVVMNPPFSKSQDALHIIHALDFLKPGGRLVAICLFRSWKPKVMAAFVAALGPRSYGVKDIPAGAFRESGTQIATALLTVS